jgi:1,4-alpha-glucan branching enzyme
MIRKESSPRQGFVRVIFEIPASVWADRIFLVGDFNNWDRRTLPFLLEHNNVWRIALDLPAQHRYEFRYLIDDHWCTDYHADGYAARNDLATNSFVDVTLPLEKMAGCPGHGLVHEAAAEHGADFWDKR